MSMVVNIELSRLERIRKILEDQHGTLLSSDLVKFNIPRTYLSILEQKGEIERVSSGGKDRGDNHAGLVKGGHYRV
jgi:Transcriptional regulator, AbiEi antitoxin